MKGLSWTCKGVFSVENKRSFFMSITAAVLFSVVSPLAASDLSDAKALRDRCETEMEQLRTGVMNFGDEKDRKDFDNAERAVRMGKVKMAQTKYREAMDQYNGYLKLHHLIYESLSKKYIDRTSALIDEVGVDMVDHIDNRKIEKYLQLASQNLREAKANDGAKHYKPAINHCRRAKEYALGAYKLAGMTVPSKYEVDMTDISGKIYKQEK
jgi:hypothetical protein